MSVKLLTLCFVHTDGQVLLGMKKRGFGAGRWNGFGGKVKPNETLVEATVRETNEEAGIVPLDLLKLGILEFTFPDKSDILEVHVFKSSTYEGSVGESEEMRPKWFEEDRIPFSQMWNDDQYWFEYLLNNKKFTGEIAFDAQDKVLSCELREVEELP